MRNIASRFRRDVRGHQMTIHHDDGLYRNIRFGLPGSSIHSFTLSTWPGYLAITGDCDDYVFTRLRDMFEFFRGDRINVDYWSEKAVAVSRHGGLRGFSEDRYVEAVRHDISSHIAGMPLSDAKQVVRAMRRDLLDDWSEPCSESEAILKAQAFMCPITGSWPLNDFWDHRLTEPSFGFVWACHAIQWGIKRYDLHKAGRDQTSHDRRVLAGAA